MILLNNIFGNRIFRALELMFACLILYLLYNAFTIELDLGLYYILGVLLSLVLIIESLFRKKVKSITYDPLQKELTISKLSLLHSKDIMIPNHELNFKIKNEKIRVEGKKTKVSFTVSHFEQEVLNLQPTLFLTKGKIIECYKKLKLIQKR